MKILFASHDRDLLRSYSTILSSDGSTVDTVFDGVQALEKLGKETYDIVIGSIPLPMAEDGQISSVCREKDIPVIELISSEVKTGMLTDRVPPCAYLSLPFEPGELEELIGVILKDHYGADVIDPDGLNVRVSDFRLNGEPITEGEMDVLRALTSGKSPDAGREWAYMSALNQKLKASGGAPFIRYSGRKGYVMERTV